MEHSNPADHQSSAVSVAEQAAVIIIENINNNSSIVSDSSFYINGTISSTTVNANLSFAESYDVPTGLICLLAFLYGSISLLAVIGNGLVILVIVKNGRMHTVTNIFIANLAVADVIIGLFSIPFQVSTFDNVLPVFLLMCYLSCMSVSAFDDMLAVFLLMCYLSSALLQRWVLANFMCSLAPFVQVISVNVSIFTLSVIAVDRYIAVIHPFKAGCSKKSAAIIISVIWAVGIGIAVPVQRYYWVDYIQEGDSLVPWCTVHPPESWSGFNDYYSMLLVCVQYLLPLVIITFCYSRIAWHIWGSRRPGAQVTCEDVRGRNKRKV
ncbi:unnamed protein product, partial [Candidula unifasciata]